MKLIYKTTAIIGLMAVIAGCNSGEAEKKSSIKTDSIALVKTDTTPAGDLRDTNASVPADRVVAKNASPKAELPVVLIYNFHITNRCASCIAIEEATTKTLATYFPDEVKQGRIRRQVLNVDDKKNQKISEKYQAFGSGLFVTRSFKGKETTADLTGDGFKYARNKEEKFIAVLQSKISEFLK